MSDLITSLDPQISDLEQSLHASLKTALTRNTSSLAAATRARAKVEELLEALTLLRTGTQPVVYITNTYALIQEWELVESERLLVQPSDVTDYQVSIRVNTVVMLDSSVTVEMVRDIYGPQQD